MLRSHRLNQESCVSKAAQTSPQHGGKQLYNTCQVYNDLHLKMSLFLLTFGADTPQVFITSMSATGTHFHVLEAEMYILLLLCLCDVIVSQNGVEFRGNWLTRKSMKKKKKTAERFCTLLMLLVVLKWVLHSPSSKSVQIHQEIQL